MQGSRRAPLPIVGDVYLDRSDFATKVNPFAVAVRFESSDSCQGWNAVLSEYEDIALAVPGAHGLSLGLRLHVTETFRVPGPAGSSVDIGVTARGYESRHAAWLTLNDAAMEAKAVPARCLPNCTLPFALARR